MSINITRYVNNSLLSPNYKHFTEAVSNSIDGDTVVVYDNNSELFRFTVRKPSNPSISEQQIKDELAKFLYIFLNSTNNTITTIKNGKKLYLDYDSNIFRLDIFSEKDQTIFSENEFNGSKISLLENLPQNMKLLVGFGDNIINQNKNIFNLSYTNGDLYNQMFFKLIDSTNFDPLDIPTSTSNNISHPSQNHNKLVIVNINENSNIYTEISLLTNKNDLSKEEFITKLYKYKRKDIFEKINMIKTNNTDYLLNKKYEKIFNFEIPTDGVIMLLNPNRYIEYSINQISHSKNLSNPINDIINRSGRILYNTGQSPKKGIYNGWRLSKASKNFINWILYDPKFDSYDLTSRIVEYFWFCIYKTNNIIQTFNINISGITTTVSTYSLPGRYIFWYSYSEILPPNNTKFNLLNSNSTFIKIQNINSANINKFSIDTINYNVELYIESYGYSIINSNQFVNIALTSTFDNNIISNQQLCLNSQYVYNLLINKFIQLDSNLPMDNLLDDNINSISNGWYFNSLKNYQINLYNNDINYDNLYTQFIEVIINNCSDFKIKCFGEIVTIPNITRGKKIIYWKRNPLDTNNYSDSPINQMVATLSQTSSDIKYYQDIDIGVHSYVVTYLTFVGETTPSINTTNISVLPGLGRVYLNNIPISSNPGIIGRKIYRTKANENSYYLLTTINDNTTTTFIDTLSDFELGNPPPEINSTSNLYMPFFLYLDTNVNEVLLNIETLFPNINWTGKKINDFLLYIGDNTDIELISYGYRTYNSKPVHFMTRWSSIDSHAIVHQIDKFLTIQKDVLNIGDNTGIDYETKFNVKAYGDFFNGNYKQYGDSYGDIRVNINCNTNAIKNALYFLDLVDITNYTIKIDALKYLASGVKIVKADGTISNSIQTLNNSKYIIPNYSASQTFNLLDYITTINGQNIFSQNGGIIPVLVQAVYAALFKEFNKSASILNNIILNSFGQNIIGVSKPNIPIISYSPLNAINLIGGAIYAYKVTFYTSIGETEASISSSNIVQPYSQAKKIEVLINVSTDIRVIGRKIYRKTIGTQNTNYNYIATIPNNTDTLFIDDIAEPISLNISNPSLSFLTTNESNYQTVDVGILLKDSANSSSLLTPNSNYKYCISYYGINNTETEPSDISEQIYIGLNPCKVLLNIPISNSNLVLGRYIYRTKANTSTFYLVDRVPNNTSSIYIDNKADINLSQQTPLITGTINHVSRPLLTFVGGSFFTKLYVSQVSFNLTKNCFYKYKFTYVVQGLGSNDEIETNGSVESEIITQPENMAYKILINLPISLDSTVIARNIYRTEGSGQFFKFVTTIPNNTTTIYIDNISDKNLGRNITSGNISNIIAPNINTTTSIFGNSDPIDILISNTITENNVPVADSQLFKLYVKSGRYDKDLNIYTNFTNTIQMDLEDMQINIKCRLKGLIYDITKIDKVLISKQLAELIFGKFNNVSSTGSVGESSTLVREVIRVGNTTYGVDELGTILDMLNNETNSDGSYKITKEIQYIIDFTLCLIQKKV